MYNILKEKTTFIIVVFSFWLFGYFLFITYGYKASFLLLNGFNNEVLDLIFVNLTNLGDPLILVSLIVLIFRINDKNFIFKLWFGVLFSGIIVQILKNYFFYDWNRPYIVFQNEINIHYVAGFVEKYKSFPSGHSTTVFCALFTLVYYKENISNFSQFIAGLSVVLISFSRIYLGVHFLFDVLIGGILGIVTVLLISIFKFNLNFIKSNYLRYISIITLLIGFILRYYYIL